MPPGYYRFPTIYNDTLVFVCEDDLWAVPVAGGVARRLTVSAGETLHPTFSPDGAWLAFTGRDDGVPEVYVMPAAGGPARRLTFLGARSRVVGWTPDGAEVVFASDTGRPFYGMSQLYAVAHSGGEPRLLPTGPALSVSFGPDGAQVIARNMTDLARWKRYRGGQSGDLWVDREGDGVWQRLVRLQGNLASPLWIGERIYFVSDHEGVGNLYSCLPTGEELRQHTEHADMYVRHPSSDGRRIVYHAGADLWLFDPASGERRPIPVELHSAQPQRGRRFVEAGEYVQSYGLHPAGQALALTIRGRAVTMGCWEGAAVQHGDEAGRTRLARYLHDGRRIVLLGDAAGEEALELHAVDGSAPPRRYAELDIGRAVTLVPSPRADLVALTNHRHELLLVDLAAGTLRTLDRSPFQRIGRPAWSPDGHWLAYSYPNTERTSIIRLCKQASGATHDATRTMLFDGEPSWDPEGHYLYFVGVRDLDPVMDRTQFAWSFPRAQRPFLITLRADGPSPFAPRSPLDETPKEARPAEAPDAAPSDDASDKSADEPAEERPDEAPVVAAPPATKPDEPALRIDLEGLADRLVAFPVPVGIYARIIGLRGGKVMFLAAAIRGASSNGEEGGKLELYDFAERSHETLLENVADLGLAQDAKTMLVRSGKRLRVLKAGEKPKENSGTSRKSGWIDLGRVKLAVVPPQEWRQMYREAWRLQRDQFWSEDMSGLDWQAIYQRYLPLLERVATRGEFSDLLWEMQGELGTSHAYEIGGDYRPGPSYRQGFLGVDLRYNAEQDSYSVARVVSGDVWDEKASSPLARPGLQVRAGDRLLAVNGRPVGGGRSPGELLVHQANADVLITLAPADGGPPRTLTVKALANEGQLRYRDWVEANRTAVHQATEGRVGYVHVPNMGPSGYAEFHRLYLPEATREGLVVDVRFNGGGNISQLLLEKLLRRRIGYGVSRWGRPGPYPRDSVLGPLVAVANEWAGSDGDIFSHSFKLLGLGPLVGTRTWGGVVGINPVDRLSDGGQTTQPEYFFWFSDVGWGVENYGAEPSVVVEIAPQDYVAGRDPQLERAIAEALRLMEERPPRLPDFGARPGRNAPALPE